MVLRKDELETSLQKEQKLIQDGTLKEDSPLDVSPYFQRLCEGCRRGDLRQCQEMITEGANINARDRFDYTPLILASLCGHYEVVELLLEAGALCERDTFQGERCLYNALNDRIRSLLLSYDYSKSSDPLQPLASHAFSLLTREHPQTSDIVVVSFEKKFRLHKFLLSARSPYFRKKLDMTPETTTWKLPSTIPPRAFEIAIKHLYFGELPSDVGGGAGTGFSDEEILEGLDKISKQLEIRSLSEGVLEAGDRRLTRQRQTEEVEKGRDQLEEWFREKVLKHTVVLDLSKVNDVKWDRDNAIFADVLLRADDLAETDDPNLNNGTSETTTEILDTRDGIPIGPSTVSSRSPSRIREACKSTLFPVHRAMLLRSEFFHAMFSSAFREAQSLPYLQIVPIDCSPDILEIVLTYLYTEKTEIPLGLAVDVVLAADLLLIDKLKVKAATVINTLGHGAMSQVLAKGGLDSSLGEQEDPIDVYDVLRAGWITRVRRLEEFAARYIADRLEDFIDEEDFAELISESAARIQKRQETDSIELLDDIRYYLSERFRLRLEDVGLEEMMDEEADVENNTSVPATADEAKPPAANGHADHHSSPAPPNSTAASQPAEAGAGAGAGADAPARGPEQNWAADIELQLQNSAVRTLDGEIASDEFAGDAVNYRILLGKIDALLERLKLDA